jgi:hypothetical protein
MKEPIDIKILRISVESHSEPYTINIRALIDSLERLRTMTDKFRQASERAIPAQLTILPKAAPVEERSAVVRAEDLEQVIIEGMVGMRHSGQIARDLLKRFQGRRFAEEEHS